MIDTIKVNNKTIPWLYVERGFEIPSFNYVTDCNIKCNTYKNS